MGLAAGRRDACNLVLAPSSRAPATTPTSCFPFTPHSILFSQPWYSNTHFHCTITNELKPSLITRLYRSPAEIWLSDQLHFFTHPVRTLSFLFRTSNTMGSYKFRWEHPEANEVFVTGTFDDWGKTEKLEKVGNVFEKTVDLDGKDKILYKFVADGNWTHNHTLPTETDERGLINNVLHPHDLTPHPTSHTMSNVAPSSTTAALAGAVPKEGRKRSSDDIPGAFPETPANEAKDFSVNPIPATEGSGNPVSLAPGEEVPNPSSLTKNTIKSTVKQDEPETMSINPIPASAGTGNPISLAPGEQVPKLSGSSVNDNVKLDKESYEAGQTGGSFDPSSTSTSSGAGAGLFGVPPVSKNMIPESSLPMGSGTGNDGALDAGPFTQSAHPQSTTATLAGAVPKEPRGVPEVVTESQKAAHFDPEASANPEAVMEKKELEAELKREVPEEPATSESGLSTGKIASAVGGGVAAAGAAVTGAAYAAKDKAVEATNNSSAIPEASSTSSAVPEVVRESIAKAHVGPEATTNAEAVREKTAVEAELEKKVHVDNSTGESAPNVAPAGGIAVPEVVKESIAKAHVGPEATTNAEAVKEKSAVEAELEKKVHVDNSTGESAPKPGPAGGLSETALSSPGPLTSSSEPKLDQLDFSGGGASTSGVTSGDAPATTPKQKELAAPSTPTKPAVSRDVSPKGGPAVVGSSSDVPPTTPAKSTAADTPAKSTAANTPAKSTTAGTPSSAKTTDESVASTDTPDSKAAKKNKRKSIFNKLKKMLN
ncbi:hypothetical protein EJ08DRAFT_82141 [Tothia fuscella]|uniref:AMP-activated protein kinase glycogen-binding domain-containing protein n=1 Tax=Tothia fuscella TaxID=1048955 RepID=A0A9P4TS78_9PEZI|nr:hypothetical protein EJ08DRAFT_82141 [Tothia fuscella]